MKTLYRIGFLFGLVLLLVGFANAQTEREKGIELFKQGDYQNAAESLKKSTDQNGNDVVGWYYLGQSLEKQNQAEKAEKAYKKVIDKTILLIEKNLEEKFTKKDGDKKQTNAEFLKPRIGAEIEAALESSKRVTELYSKKSFSKDWETKSLILKMFEEKAAVATPDKIDSGQSSGIVIIKKPFAGYTEKARANKTSGTIRLLVQFLSNGEIGLVISLHRLPDGLTEEGIAAARGIKFQPQVKNGNPITVFKQIEYSFSIY